jgi:hypothetical protein
LDSASLIELKIEFSTRSFLGSSTFTGSGIEAVSETFIEL